MPNVSRISALIYSDSMPSSQLQTSCQPSQIGGNSQISSCLPLSKPPPPNKPPPPPPPPPLPMIKTARPPPPPPRNSSQLLSQNSISTSGQLCGASLPSSATPGLLNNGSSMSSINLAGRCNHVSPGQPIGSMTMTHSQRNFLKHGADNCSSRSSVSSHSSLQHHHLQHLTTNGNGGVGTGVFQQVTCAHQQPANMGCICSGSGMQHTNSSSHSDNGSCNHVSYSQDNRGFIQMSHTCHNGCLGVGSNHHSQLHQLNSSTKCQSQINGSNINISGGRSSGQSIGSSATIGGRNPMFYNNGENLESSLVPSSCMNEVSSRNHCQSSHLPPAPPPHNHHHHHIHNGPLSPSSSLSSLPPVESSSYHRCNMSQSSSTAPSIASDNQLMQRPVIPPGAGTVGHCNHVIHRTNGGGCAHHHQANFCDYHIPASHVIQHQQIGGSHECSNCSHMSSSNVASQHHDCGLMMIGKTCANGHLHHHHHNNFQQELMPTNRSSDASNNDSLLSTTAHSHNLSNSSTTTHTSNVAVKHQPHFHNRPTIARGMRSNSSQQYDQYGLSSAASTSSATASLSSYQMPTGYEDLVPLFPGTKSNHQPLPPPPPPIFKSRPTSPATSTGLLSSQMNSNNSGNNNGNNNNSNMPFVKTQFLNKQELQYNQSLPPLPPKPLSPNASSTSTQITTLGSSPNLASQPITRVTSQAGVQNPLPSSDVPPPLPPSNPGSRQQPLLNTFMARIQQNSNINDINQNPIPNFINLNIGSRSMTLGPTDAERKTEILTRQVELELEQQQKSGEPLGVCPECGDRVMMAQDACKAMNKIYHATCFVCCECNRTLLGKTFYPVGNRVYCEEDFNYTGHMQSLEKCAACTKPIFDMILPAMGKSYHPECFKCCVCSKCLDGVPFTIDAKNKIYCVSDYHSIYSPKCAACGKSIAPIDGTSETVRVVSMDKDYHIDCYCCEDCGLQLTDEEPSQSYPLDNHLLCQQCHINRLSERQLAIIGQ